MKSLHQERDTYTDSRFKEYRAHPVSTEYDQRLPLSQALSAWATDTPKRLYDPTSGCTYLSFQAWCTLTLAAYIVEKGWTPAIGACLKDISFRCDCLDPKAYLFSADAAIRRAAHELGFTDPHLEQVLEGYHVTLIDLCRARAWESIDAQKAALIMRAAALLITRRAAENPPFLPLT